ncbi:MAG: FAD-binding oxidoreductase, partial [Burkholderiaceae bacterium]
IIQKHAALGVLPEHYPIVGTYLLRAVKDVLGDVATDEVIAAWAEAYESLAALLIAAEEEVYCANAARTGGWRGLREFVVARREDESEVITSFYLEPTDGGLLLAFSPGQYLTLVLEIDGEPVRRNYSLSDAPGKPWYRISVKQEGGGRASNWLHKAAAVGTRLQVQAPCGDFVLQPAGERERPLVLITGGVGITPAMSMLESMAHTGRPVHFVHAARHGGAHAFRDRVDALAAQHENVKPLYVYDAPRDADRPHATGFITRELMAELLPADRDVDLYFLGPKPFMKAVYANGRALGVPKHQLRYEFFGPLEALEALEA